MVRSLASPWSCSIKCIPPCPHWLIRWPRSKVQGVKRPFRRRLLLPRERLGNHRCNWKSVLRCFFGGVVFPKLFFLFGFSIGCLLVYASRRFRKKIEKLWDCQLFEKVVSLLENSLIETWWNITNRLEAEVLVWLLLQNYPTLQDPLWPICYMDPWKILVKFQFQKHPAKAFQDDNLFTIRYVPRFLRMVFWIT